MNWDNEHISELLMLALAGELTEEEERQFELWLAENHELRQMWIKMQRKGGIEQELSKLNTVDAEEAYRCFQRQQKQHRLRHYLRYAAILLPFGLLTAWCVELLFHDKKPTEALFEQIAQIVPGEMKAELILEDGTAYKLGGEEYNMQLKEGAVTVAILNGKLQYNQSGADVRNMKPKYNTLIVPRGGEYTLVLGDGTTVYLNADSKLKYPEHFTGGDREVFLEGEAFFEVTKQQGAAFLVHTAKETVQVLGTSFNVRAYRDEEFEATTLVTGKVLVNTAGKQEVNMLPGEQCCLNDNGELSKREVDVYSYIAWKEGIFAFDKVPLDEVMRTLERWYNVDICIAAEEMKKVPVSGKIKRFSDFKQVLELLEVMGIRFQMNENTLIVK